MPGAGEVEIGTADELAQLVGAPVARVRDKVRDRLSEDDRAWLAVSPFCLVATSDAEGRCDVSPKGDPPGELARVIDDRTVVIADRPGNRRLDGFRNVLDNPHVGLLFVVPGRGDTLRVNGRARLLREAPWFDDLSVRGHRPLVVLHVEVTEVFFHCAKAFLRSSLWEPQSWRPDAVPSRARIAHRLERPEETVEALEAYYGPSYADRLY